VAQSAPDDPLARYQAEVSRFNSEVHRHYADQAAGRRSTIVFCATIDLAHDAALVFSSLVVESRALSSRTSEAEQMEIIRLFRVGELRMLAVCMMLIEGFDLPQVSSVKRSHWGS
jgi:ATP-dependent helicase IRC3